MLASTIDRNSTEKEQQCPARLLLLLLLPSKCNDTTRRWFARLVSVVCRLCAQVPILPAFQSHVVVQKSYTHKICVDYVFAHSNFITAKSFNVPVLTVSGRILRLIATYILDSCSCPCFTNLFHSDPSETTEDKKDFGRKTVP